MEKVFVYDKNFGSLGYGFQCKTNLFLKLSAMASDFGKKKNRRVLKRLFRVLKNSKSELSKKMFGTLDNISKRIAFKTVKNAVISSYKAGLKNGR